VALLVVLAFVIILAVLASVFAVNMQVEAKLARNADAGTEVEWLCRSGVEMAKYVLSQQMADTQQPYDSLSQSWAGGPGSTNGFNPLLDSIDLTDSAWGEGTLLGLLYPIEDPGEGYRCSIKIMDMERKFNINRAAERSMGRYPLEQTFEMMGVDVSLIPYLVDAIIDWRDQDSAVGVNGAESEYYEPLGYLAKNGPIDDLRELLLIKDITPEMYWGNATNSLVAGTVPTAVEEEGESLNYNYALVDLFTPLSLGYININTAPAEVLQLVPLPGNPAVTAEEIVRVRAGLDGVEGTYDDDPYDTVSQLQLVPGFTRDAVSNASRFFSVRSSTFEVKVTASVRGQERILVAVLQRKNPTEIKILYTYWES
jgi:general secretion pathway protein K